MKYYSQYKQDYWVDKLLNEKSNGLFLDIGANDGITISNTWFFEQHRNWTGICVEPIPSVYEKLASIRKCKCLNVCISDKAGVEVFFNLGMLSGIKSDYHPSHWERIVKDAEKETDVVQEFEVSCVPANNILAEYGHKHFDFLSIDTEGSELKILKGIDLDTYSFSLICVENPYHDKGFEDLLVPKGYVLCKILAGCDYLFVNKNVTEVYNAAKPHILAFKTEKAFPVKKYTGQVKRLAKRVVKKALNIFGLYKTPATSK